MRLHEGFALVLAFCLAGVLLNHAFWGLPEPVKLEAVLPEKVSLQSLRILPNVAKWTPEMSVRQRIRFGFLGLFKSMPKVRSPCVRAILEQFRNNLECFNARDSGRLPVLLVLRN